jgi:hypothetical protein
MIPSWRKRKALERKTARPIVDWTAWDAYLEQRKAQERELRRRFGRDGGGGQPPEEA